MSDAFRDPSPHRTAPPAAAIEIDALDAAVASPGAFDELRASADPAAPLAEPWRALLAATRAAGAESLAARAAQVQRRVRDDGATYTVHTDGGDRVQAWPLQLLPFIVPAPEWPQLAAGVRQRARLLNATLADLYGAQTLLREAVLPPSLVYAHPQYLRPLHGVVPAGGIYLHLAAFDLARGSDGVWRVLAQRLQAPSGLGYLLQNRLILGQVMHEARAALCVQRLGAALRTLIDAMRRLSPAGERAHIALLTPGPAHETYFEQVFLARQFGLSLVEGCDLTVRARQLFLKTMHGLQRVDVVLRRVDDAWVDPLELRADSTLGVPGLLQVLRAGEVVLANVPGAGVLESPGLAAFWPGVAQRLLGEDLLLPASTHWWCGEASVWRSQRGRLADYVVAPSFPAPAGGPASFEPLVAARLDAAGQARLLERIDADPAAYTLQSPVQPSQTPVWEEGALALRPAVLRVFAITDGRGDWCVVPGALARIAAGASASTDPWLSMQHGSVSADTWVLADGEPEAMPAAGATLQVADLIGRESVVSSRAAENLFWLGRYTERAEFVVALMRLVFENLHSVDAAVHAWFDDLARSHELVDAEAPPLQQSPAAFARALARSLPAASGKPSVGFDLRSLATCARALRERLSPEHWRLIEQLGDHFEQHVASALRWSGDTIAAADIAGVLGRAATHLAAVTGAQTDRMVRDDGWRLLSVARQLERIDTLGHALARGLELRLHDNEEGFALLLALFDCGITYRARFQTRRELLPLAHLLLADLDHPRSLAWVARTLRERLRKLARHEPAWAAEAAAAVPAPETWPLDALAGADGAGADSLAHSLHASVDALRALSDAIGHRLFAHVDTDHAVWQ